MNRRYVLKIVLSMDYFVAVMKDSIQLDKKDVQDALQDKDGTVKDVLSQIIKYVKQITIGMIYKIVVNPILLNVESIKNGMVLYVFAYKHMIG